MRHQNQPQILAGCLCTCTQKWRSCLRARLHLSAAQPERADAVTAAQLRSREVAPESDLYPREPPEQLYTRVEELPELPRSLTEQEQARAEQLRVRAERSRARRERAAAAAAVPAAAAPSRLTWQDALEADEAPQTAGPQSTEPWQASVAPSCSHPAFHKLEACFTPFSCLSACTPAPWEGAAGAESR